MKESKKNNFFNVYDHFFTFFHNNIIKLLKKIIIKFTSSFLLLIGELYLSNIIIVCFFNSSSRIHILIDDGNVGDSMTNNKASGDSVGMCWIDIAWCEVLVL